MNNGKAQAGRLFYPVKMMMQEERLRCPENYKLTF